MNGPIKTGPVSFWRLLREAERRQEEEEEEERKKPQHQLRKKKKPPLYFFSLYMYIGDAICRHTRLFFSWPRRRRSLPP
jgi:hypothetical protein